MLTTTRIGPADRGRTMTVDEFAAAEWAEGYLYELSRGSLDVNEVANPPHFHQVQAIIEQLVAYKLSHPGVIESFGGGADTRIVVGELESARHPDMAVYKTPAPSRGRDCWSIWVPELVIEIVSPDSRHRDYEEKPEEYLQFGVQEYWILDADRGEMLVYRRVAGRWQPQTIKPPERYATDVLPDLQFSCEAVFAAAAK